MALYYSLVFGLLVTELPLPNTWRVKTLKFVSESQVVARVIHGIKIALAGVLILFVDAVNKMFNVGLEAEKIHEGKADLNAASVIHANKFYAQRNVYLTGFTLFMSFIITRTYVMILDLSSAAIHVTEPEVPVPPPTLSGTKSKKVE
ncbi:B-cell receptor-associated protein 31-like-domain-containing protein [Thamnocephalis sphaerospora]|uniref:Endoplasmic reticulum transmembrane protein n=1 Tax=Thamnocephalis sphaerospora TaxID=78915 RepID=A0A4P9XNE8_9FUNG|nr:B-cell receptor-associated protein 31-like-domain-containing protein [Thamnocephalis sphaerospora]|eukprot:RKP07483.1 B-cell receptor-associated protein 31-like-domain-containing protein [Thamnocephalis sphaerospora]